MGLQVRSLPAASVDRLTSQLVARHQGLLDWRNGLVKSDEHREAHHGPTLLLDVLQRVVPWFELRSPL